MLLGTTPIFQAHGAPEWLQPTYNLETHLAQLIGDCYTRERDGVDNLWILKPWNMARTIDTTVTRNLSQIIRLMETGPKICQKYIEHPALFRGKKFDLRYIILVRSINPLEIFISEVFWVCVHSLFSGNDAIMVLVSWFVIYEVIVFEDDSIYISRLGWQITLTLWSSTVYLNTRHISPLW